MPAQAAASSSWVAIMAGCRASTVAGSASLTLEAGGISHSAKRGRGGDALAATGASIIAPTLAESRPLSETKVFRWPLHCCWRVASVVRAATRPERARASSTAAAPTDSLRRVSSSVTCRDTMSSLSTAREKRQPAQRQHRVSHTRRRRQADRLGVGVAGVETVAGAIDGTAQAAQQIDSPTQREPEQGAGGLFSLPAIDGASAAVPTDATDQATSVASCRATYGGCVAQPDNTAPVNMIQGPD